MGLTREQREERERLADSGMKRCSVGSGCGEIKSVDEFGSHKGKWDNKSIICRICDRNTSRKYRKENPEVVAAYYQEHREEKRQYYLDNLDARREYNRTYIAKKRRDDPIHYRLKVGKARAKKAGAEWEDISFTELLSYWEQRDITIDTCHYCKQTIDEDQLEIDHGIPIGRDGGHTLDNLFPSHKRCNMSKGKRTVEEYLEYLKQVA